MLGKEEIVSPALDELKEHYQRIITLLGEDAEREGLSLIHISEPTRP